MSFSQRIFGLSSDQLAKSDDVGALIAAIRLKSAVFQSKYDLNQARCAAVRRLAELSDPHCVEARSAALIAL
jgi:hypothetical protein